MNALSHPFLLAGGALLLLLGWMLWRWSSRHDLKGMAVDAAWQVAKNRGNLATETELGQRLRDVQADASSVGKAKKVAGYAARHFAAQVAGLAGLIGMAGGGALLALAIFWK